MVRFNLDQGQITFLPQKNTEKVGYSDTGEQIRLVNHTMILDIEIEKIHPDVLALICTLGFYNYLKNAQELIYPKPVSPQFRQILALHGIKPMILNDDPLIKGLRPRPRSICNNIALSWGGGFDSWATYLLQPNLYSVIIHHNNHKSPIPKPIFSNSTPNNKELEYVLVNSNIRELSEIENKKNEPAGWVVWPQVLIPVLVLAEKYKLDAISLGGNLGSVFLKDGSQYHPTHLKPSIWFKTFEAIGLPLYVPLAGLTDLAIFRFLEKNEVDFGQIKYCSLSTTTENCHQCPKCFRRELLLGRDKDVPICSRGPSVDYLQRGKKEYESWIDKYYQPAFQLIPDIKINDSSLKAQLKDSLIRAKIELLPKKDEELVEHYGW